MRARRLRTPLAAAILALGLAMPLAAAIGAPTDGKLTIGAEDSPVTYGSSTTIRGKLLADPVKSNVPVLLQHQPAPYTGEFETIDTTTTNGKGAYSFGDVGPDQHTRYRVRSAVPQAVSREVPVEVRINVVLRLSDRTPRAGERVRFYGTAAPEHDGRVVYIQRRNKGGKWRTSKRVALHDAGDELSRFATRIRVRRDGTYRAKVFHDADHADGASRPKRATVG